jgi:integrase
MSWAMREGLVEANPVVGTNKPAESAPRDRVLADEELAAVWAACRDDDLGRIVKLLILTGSRREEIAALRWPEVDFESAVVTCRASAPRTAGPTTSRSPARPSTS